MKKPEKSAMFAENRSKKPSRPKRAEGGQASACRQPGNILRKQDIRGDTMICSHKYNGIIGRLDSYVSTNKAMGIGFQRKGVEPQSPKFTLTL